MTVAGCWSETKAKFTENMTLDKYINIYKIAVSTLKGHKIKVDMEKICDKFLMNVAHQDYIDHAVNLLSDDKRTFQMAQEKLEARQLALTIMERCNSRDGGTLRRTKQSRDQQYKGKDGARGNDKGSTKEELRSYSSPKAVQCFQGEWPTEVL